MGVAIAFIAAFLAAFAIRRRIKCYIAAADIRRMKKIMTEIEEKTKPKTQFY